LKKILLLALALSAFTITSPVTIDQARAACGDEAGENVNWEGCRKRNLVLTGSNMKQANFKGTNFSSTDMRDSEFDNSDFQKAVLLRVFFDRSSAVNANFEKAIVYRVNFKETNLENAIFQKSEMLRANFTGANLVSANFSKAEAGRSVFTNAMLGNNDFSYASLARADFRDANINGPLNFEGAYLYQTKLGGVNLSHATGLQQWQIDMTCGDEKTILPEGVKRPQSWSCDED